MKTPFSSSYRLERCAPAPAKFTLEPEPQFFIRADTRKAFFMSVAMDGDGEMVSATGLDFSDVQGMNCTVKKATPRRKPTPIYAVDPTAMRKLIVRFMERRAHLPGTKFGPLPGTEAERLERAKTAILADVPRLDALATSLCQRYVDGRKNGADPEWLRMMETQIQNADSQLHLAREVPAILVGVIYRSYCLSEDSVAVGEGLGILPTSVRQMLSRLGALWKRMEAEDAGTLVPDDARRAHLRATPAAAVEPPRPQRSESLPLHLGSQPRHSRSYACS